jgi:hypothetical protein
MNPKMKDASLAEFTMTKTSQSIRHRNSIKTSDSKK